VSGCCAQAQLLKLAPGLKKFGVLPVDGIHPKGIVSDAFGTGEVPIESMLDLSPFPGAVSRTNCPALACLATTRSSQLAALRDDRRVSRRMLA